MPYIDGLPAAGATNPTDLLVLCQGSTGVPGSGTDVALALSALTTAAGVASFNTRTGAVTLLSADVTSALAFTPYSAANPSGFQTAANVTTSLASYALTASVAGLAPVQSVASRTGVVTLTHSDLTDWASATSGFGGSYTLPTASTTVLGGVKVDGSSVTISGGVISASGVSSGVSGFNTRTGAVSLTSGDVTTALTFTPYNATNPSAFIAAAGAPVQSVATRTGAVTLTHADLTDWAASLSTYAPLAAPTLTGLHETRVAMGANNIDCNAGNVFTKTISGTTTLTVSNVPASGTVASIILELTNGGSAAITWWSGVKWAGGAGPTLTTSGIDDLGFFTFDGGTTWRGLVLGKAMA